MVVTLYSSEWVVKFVGSIFHSKLLNLIPLFSPIYIAFLSTEEWDQFRVDNLWDFSTVKRKISNWIAINLFLSGGGFGENAQVKKGIHKMMQWEIGIFLRRLKCGFPRFTQKLVEDLLRVRSRFFKIYTLQREILYIGMDKVFKFRLRLTL